jgi:poly(3-hydroxybutyrate) depolymerase
MKVKGAIFKYYHGGSSVMKNVDQKAIFYSKYLILYLVPLILIYFGCQSAPTDEEAVLGTMKNWKTMNNCTGTYEITWNSGNSVAWTFQNCDNNTEVSLVTIDGGGHILYKGEGTEINTTRLAWDFMKRFSK